MPSLYLHIPFCKRKCPYCDFYSIPYSYSLANIYIDILIEQISSLNHRFRTIYIGGGTPTSLEIRLLEKLLDKLSPFLEASRENTIEANPESLEKKKLKLFLERGINRLSIGAQSLRNEKLKALGRIHFVEDTERAIFEAREIGFENINIDLIYGLWGESWKEWQSELGSALNLPLTHISCYALSFTRGSRIWNWKDKVDEAEVAKMYLFNMQFLPPRGFLQYEVSNFSRPGFECLHNLNYWEGGEYLGLGASAVSFIRGERIGNISTVEEYIKRIKKGESHYCFREKLSPLKRARELASLMIRMKRGIDLSDFEEKTGFEFFQVESKEKINYLKKQGLIKIQRQKGEVRGISLTRRGFLFCDEVSSEFV